MSVSTLVREMLMDPRVRVHNVDDDAMLGIHTEILAHKQLMRSAFVSFYRQMESAVKNCCSVQGREIELGTGAGFFKALRPEVITSDIRQNAKCDLVLDAQEMALANESVRCFYAINVFHHLPDPNRFFLELIRVLRPGGVCVLIEPHGGPASALLHRRLHAEEIFDVSMPSWQNALINGAMSGANQALAHIVFKRDLSVFERQYGECLEIARREYCCNSLRYFLSGGLNFRQLVPSMAEPILRLIENTARPLAKYWSLHELIVLRKPITCVASKHLAYRPNET